MDGLTIIKIYGSDSDCIINGRMVKYPAKADVLAKTDLATYELEVRGCYDGIESNPETSKYWNGGTLTLLSPVLTYNPKSVPIPYSDTKVSLESVSGLPVMKKMFKWIDLGDYAYQPQAIITDNTLISAINIDGIEIEHLEQEGVRNISLNISER